MLVFRGSEEPSSRHSNSQFWLEEGDFTTEDYPYDGNPVLTQEDLDEMCKEARRIWTLEELQEDEEFLTDYDYDQNFYEVVAHNAWTLVWE